MEIIFIGFMVMVQLYVWLIAWRSRHGLEKWMVALLVVPFGYFILGAIFMFMNDWEATRRWK